MASAINGFGPIGATCGGCVYGPWNVEHPQEPLERATRIIYGGHIVWLCGLSAAHVTHEERACGLYEPVNGTYTEPMYPSRKV